MTRERTAETQQYLREPFWKTLFSYPLLVFLNCHKMTIYVADMAEIQTIIWKEKTDSF